MENLKTKIHVYVTIALLMVSSFSYGGGGWTMEKGKGYYQLSQFWTISDGHYTSTGKIDPNVTNGLFNTNAYVEYGITDRIDGILFVPIFSRALYNNLISGTTGDTIQAGEAINSIGDANISVKYGLITNKPWVLSTSLLLGLPIGESSGGSLGILQTGDGEFNQLIRFDLSTSGEFVERPSWFSVYSGFNNRTNGFSDEFHYGIELGMNASKKFGLTLKLDGLKSFKNGASSDSNPTSIFANNSEFLIARPGIFININEKLGILGEWSQPLAGRLIFSDPAYSAGVFLRL